MHVCKYGHDLNRMQAGLWVPILWPKSAAILTNCYTKVHNKKVMRRVGTSCLVIDIGRKPFPPLKGLFLAYAFLAACIMYYRYDSAHSEMGVYNYWWMKQAFSRCIWGVKQWYPCVYTSVHLWNFIKNNGTNLVMHTSTCYKIMHRAYTHALHQYITG